MVLQLGDFSFDPNHRPLLIADLSNIGQDALLAASEDALDAGADVLLASHDSPQKAFDVPVISPSEVPDTQLHGNQICRVEAPEVAVLVGTIANAWHCGVQIFLVPAGLVQSARRSIDFLAALKAHQ